MRTIGRAFRTAIAALLVVGLPSFGVQEDADSTRADFVAAVGAERAESKRAVDAADREYELLATALDAASSGLTADARERLAEGPLADARRTRDTAIGTARATYSRRIEEAVQAYPPAASVYDAAKETLRALRTEFEVYKVVLEAAEVAAADAGSAAGAAGRTDSGRARNFAELQARADTAEAAYERAHRAYEEAVRARPERVEPRKTAGENFGRFLEGLNSLAAGDRAGADRSVEEIGRTREAALLDAQEANEAAMVDYNDAVTRAREARAKANAAYRAAAAAAQRAAVDAARARADRASASEGYEDALAIRRAAFVNAARVTRVYEADEWDAAQHALMAGVLSAIAELETEVLGRVSKDEALAAIETALTAYADPRLTALAPLEDLEAKHVAAAEAASAARAALKVAQATNERRVADGRGVLQQIESNYERAVGEADRVLDDAVVESFRIVRMKRAVTMRTDAAAAHMRTMEAARASRQRFVVRAFPRLNVSKPRYPVLTGLESSWGTVVVSSVTRYRENRRAADARYRQAVLAALTTNTQALAAEARSTAVARNAARDAYDAASAAAQAAISFDEKARARLPTLEADVRGGLVAAAHASFSEGSPLNAQATSTYTPKNEGRP